MTLSSMSARTRRAQRIESAACAGWDRHPGHRVGGAEGPVEHGAAGGGERAGDEQVRLGDARVGEDVLVQVGLELVGDRGAQRDHRALLRQFPGGGLAEGGDGGVRQGRRGEDEVE